MSEIYIYWNDLTPEKQKEILKLTNPSDGDCKIFPVVATIRIDTNGIDWVLASDYLNVLMRQYKSMGLSGQPGLECLYPLKKRLDDGERTKKLYDEIMSC